MGRSDELLALRAARGDRRAFDAIYRRYGDSLYRFCLAMTGSSYDAQDALQNAMVKALRALPGEERQIRLKPWLYRVAHNEAIEVLRRRRDTEQLDPEQRSHGSVAETAELRERLRTLLADLELLPERQRAVLLMRELAGLDFADIAAAYETSAAAARQTLYEARLNLREFDRGRERRQIDIRSDLTALAPLPAGGLLKLLRGLLGAGREVGGSSGALAGTVSPAAQTIAVPVAVKSAVAVALVVGTATVADRSGAVDLLGRQGKEDAVLAAKPHGESPGRVRAVGASPAQTGRRAAGTGTRSAREGRSAGAPSAAAAAPASRTDSHGWDGAAQAPVDDADHAPQGSPPEQTPAQAGQGPANAGDAKAGQGQQGQVQQSPEAAEAGLQAASDRGAPPGAGPPPVPPSPAAGGPPPEAPRADPPPPPSPPAGAPSNGNAADSTPSPGGPPRG